MKGGPGIVIKKISADGNDVTILPFGLETIDGAGSGTISAQWDSFSGVAA